jgi:hypothetical protein
MPSSRSRPLTFFNGFEDRKLVPGRRAGAGTTRTPLEASTHRFRRFHPNQPTWSTLGGQGQNSADGSRRHHRCGPTCRA